MESWVTIARLGRAWGRRGEVLADALSSRPERYAQLREVFLFGPGRELDAGRRLVVESVFERRNRLVFKFRGVDSISDAQQLCGAEVCVPLSERSPLPPGEHYHSDLVGCDVVERSGRLVGKVTSLEEYGGPVLLKIEGTDGELLVPFARSICVEIDTAARRIVVELPRGMKELNEGTEAP